MRFFTLGRAIGRSPSSRPGSLRQRPRSFASSSPGPPVPTPPPPPPPPQPPSRLNPLLKAALTSGVLSVTGDLVAQALSAPRGASSPPPSVDAARAARLGGFGFVLYGPAQHYWYRWLAATFPMVASAPLRTQLPAFFAKVALNQLALGPVVVTSVFAWNAAFHGTLAQLPAKLRRDALPTLRKGWAFWIPAASVNFVWVPLQHQVLYMSVCSIVWTCILSSATAAPAVEVTEVW